MDGRNGQVGTILSEARLRQGLTLADIASSTKVSTRYLEALEHDAFSELPSKIHALGFARAFANCVCIDADEIADAVRARLGKSDGQGASDIRHERKRRGRPVANMIGAARSFLSL
ncbi:helix-turn-helix domain-containing protein [Croceicoccus gelatinilyticus]|uniref:helix-turn-helix domain-containing protein n=1 Tax=Croceicoccus gelatinilyticus TaxID=2835536 RepID=UPI001BCF4CCA|nr:helix-turn-helix transcriptional regulator [Croceicoccus gelatinilyticus]MBS7671460.1 helix-turn-helix domain-containing protein [Croceicoccus gelatinilyticus]